MCGRVAGDKAGGRYGQGCANEFTFCLGVQGAMEMPYIMVIW